MQLGKPFVMKVFESHYCKIVFLLSLLLSYFLIPEGVWGTKYLPLAIIFMLTFSILVACTVRHIKERTMGTLKYSGLTLSALLTILGISSLQACVASLPACGATVAAGVFTVTASASLSELLSLYFHRYALHIFLAGIGFQLLTLYYMGCFRKVL